MALNESLMPPTLKNALKFFGQTMQSFKIHKIDAEHYEITAPMKDKDGRNMGTTRRVFNAITNELETTRHD